ARPRLLAPGGSGGRSLPPGPGQTAAGPVARPIRSAARLSRCPDGAADVSAEVRGGLRGPPVGYPLGLRAGLGAFRRAVALNQATTWAARGLCAGLAVDLALLVARWSGLASWLRVGQLALLALPLLAALAAAGLGASRPRRLDWVARRLDARL